VLNLDDSDNHLDLETVLGTSIFYGLNANQAIQIMQEVVTVMDGWREMVRTMRIARADIELMAGAFAAHEQFHHAPKC